MLEIPWNGVKMLLEIPWEGSKKNEVPQQGGGVDINWNSPILYVALSPLSTSTVSQQKVAYSTVSISLVLPKCSRNTEIRYVSLRYG